MQDLRPGEYSQPVTFSDERGRRGVRIVYLKTRTEPHRENLKDDYSKIAARALEDKKGTAIENWFNTRIKNYHVTIDEAYRDCVVMEKWISAATASTLK
jgi:peptidyl-prolyl cis-trans isomerase SurA